MEKPVTVQFHNMDPSPAVEEQIHKRAAALEKHFDRITRCEVTVEAPHRHHYKGKLYSVRIVLHVPRKELVVNHNGPQDHAHEDVYVAVRDAFQAATRQLDDYARKLRGEVKDHSNGAAD